ncbi:MAG TPA: CpsB/CapC family capsule biosynthesis tyrosine phosphatase [Flavobacteriales bacterium]|jgi:tyrosine-protein phosphatase YwqE|nr:CpsB/CapC family capsule biosynthesis tyrosine phosphatase [Flavobacteriales bacterium]
MGLFSKLFGGGGPAMPPADLSVLRCDVHSHFIPGIDDGAQTMENSIELIRAMHELGYTKVITTPHVMADGFRNTPEIILAGLQRVREELAAQGIPVEIDASAEYYLDHEFDRLVKERQVIPFGDNYVLFELPFIAEPAILFNVIFQLQTQGYKPVLAHPERYQFWHTDLAKYEALKERGVLFQLNMVALMGAYGPSARKIAEKLIDNGWYELLGSDCHSMNHVEAIKATLSEPYLHKLLASGKLLNAKL